ncbi:hypothetical protein BaRGS_00016729 [Batillaria attramentaria]|uniref:Uncharacterized protein n=1 Tax=Batillaria attramentaria TaxID=370345 RepID=A0ABD0KY41_9CAEN
MTGGPVADFKVPPDPARLSTYSKTVARIKDNRSPSSSARGHLKITSCIRPLAVAWGAMEARDRVRTTKKPFRLVTSSIGRYNHERAPTSPYYLAAALCLRNDPKGITQTGLRH